jgi:putative cell wall-binding protein
MIYRAKRSLLVFYMVIFVLMIAPVLWTPRPLAAGSTTTSSDYEYTSESGETTITYYGGPGGAVEIPSELGGFPVTGINPSVFANKELTEVTIPESVTDIGAWAFAGNELTSVTIPAGVTAIHTYTFANNKLTDIFMGSQVTLIDDYAFYINQLTYFVAPAELITIGELAFSDNMIEYLYLGQKLETIEPVAFGWNQLSSVTVPSSVTSIASEAFAGNPLHSATVPASVLYFGEYALGPPSSSVTIYGQPASVAASYAHEYDHVFVAAVAGDFVYTVQSDQVTISNYLGRPGGVVIPAAITSLPVTAVGDMGESWDQSFTGKGLTSVHIPNSITRIGTMAFAQNSLTAVTLPPSLSELGDYAFAFNQLTSIEIPSTLTQIRGGAFTANQISTVEIPGSVTCIGEAAFFNNKLTHINIPDNVTTLEHSAFGSNLLTSARLPSGLTHLPSYLFYNNKFTEFTIPDGIVHIGEYAFYSNQLANLHLPGGLEHIGFAAFMYNDLTDIRIPSGTRQIDQWAFRYNPLSSAVIPSSVSSMGENVFMQEAVPPADLTIYGQLDTTACMYAEAYGHTFVPSLSRLAGSNRYSTAVALSQQGFPEGADVVLLARGDNFPDSLAGVSLAHQLEGPILLTASGALTPVSKQEIQRLGASRVIILGGTGAVSTDVETEVQSISGVSTVDRLGGANRYETAAMIAAEMILPDAPTVFMASANDFPDALSAAAYAAQMGVPILLTGQNSLPAATKTSLSTLAADQVMIVGGTAAVSDHVLNELNTLGLATMRISGTNRYLTAVELANQFLSNENELFIATGLNFPDALAGGVLAARKHSGILLVSGAHSTLPGSVSTFISTHGIKSVTILGGTGAVSGGIETNLLLMLD